MRISGSSSSPRPRVAIPHRGIHRHSRMLLVSRISFFEVEFTTRSMYPEPEFCCAEATIVVRMSFVAGATFVLTHNFYCSSRLSSSPLLAIFLISVQTYASSLLRSHSSLSIACDAKQSHVEASPGSGRFLRLFLLKGFSVIFSLCSFNCFRLPRGKSRVGFEADCDC